MSDQEVYEKAKLTKKYKVVWYNKQHPHKQIIAESKPLDSYSSGEHYARYTRRTHPYNICVVWE